MGSSKVLPHWVMVDLGVMAMKGFSIFSRTGVSPSDGLIDTCWTGGRCYSSAEVYSTAPTKLDYQSRRKKTLNL